MVVDTIDTDLLRAYSNSYVAVFDCGVGAPTEDGINEALSQDHTDIFGELHSVPQGRTRLLPARGNRGLRRASRA